MRRNTGFSLTELLTVVAIIGILGAVGYPAYSDYTQQALLDGQAALLSMATEQERFYLSNNTYSAIADIWTASGGQFESLEGYYTLEVVSGNANTFVVRATATGIQAADTDCAVMELDNTDSAFGPGRRR